MTYPLSLHEGRRADRQTDVLPQQWRTNKFDIFLNVSTLFFWNYYCKCWQLGISSPHTLTSFLAVVEVALISTLHPLPPQRSIVRPTCRVGDMIESKNKTTNNEFKKKLNNRWKINLTCQNFANVKKVYLKSKCLKYL